MKLLGLIGGTSYHSTLEYYEAINRKVAEQIGQSQNPPLLLYSINIDVMRRQDEQEIIKTYLNVAKTLEKAGAEALLICANTPHMVVEHVQLELEIPFLHIADAVARKAKPNYSKLLLLGNKPTMTKDFMRSYLSKHHNFEVIIPEAKSIEQSHYFVSKELTQGQFTEEAKMFYKSLIASYKDEVDAVILGCTELPILLKDEAIEVPTLATTDLHIQSAVDFILQDV